MERIAATRLRHFGGWIKPRAVTATRPWPGANIESCSYAAAWRHAPFSFSRSFLSLCRICCAYYSAKKGGRRIAPGSRVAASPNVSPGQRPHSGHSPGYRSDTPKSELRSCDSVPHRIPHKERRIAPGSRVAASPNVSPGQRPRSGHSPGVNPASKMAEPRSGDSFHTSEMNYETLF